MISMTRSARSLELSHKRWKVRVNGISPGAIRTRINRAAWQTPEAEAELIKLIPYEFPQCQFKHTKLIFIQIGRAYPFL